MLLPLLGPGNPRTERMVEPSSSRRMLPRPQSEYVGFGEQHRRLAVLHTAARHYTAKRPAPGACLAIHLKAAVEKRLTYCDKACIFHHMVKYADTLNDIFFALADPTRRAIVAQLSHGELTVGVLAEPFKISPSGFSKHLRVLERAGLMVQRKRGRQRYCRLVVAPLKEATTWLEQYRQLWETSLDAFATYVADLEKAPQRTTPPGRRKQP